MYIQILQLSKTLSLFNAPSQPLIFFLFLVRFPRQTPVEDVPLAIAPFQGRVLVGVGKLLRIYDMGKKKLLRKCENKVSVPRRALFGWREQHKNQYG